MQMHRAYALLNVKRVNEDQRVITGTATTPTPDRMGDIVEPLGIKFINPLPLLHMHRTDQPVGTVRFDKPTEDGITFTARMPNIEEPGPLRDRVDTAWGELKLGLVRGVSIGFRSIETSFMKDGGIHFLETEVLELSLVTVPANAEATIDTIRSIDTQQTSSGPARRDQPAGVSASIKPVKAQEAKTMKKTLAEQIAAFEATRASKAARLDEIMEASGEKGETLDAAQKEEFDTIEKEVAEIDDHLRRLRSREKVARETAKPVEGGDLIKASESRGASGNGSHALMSVPATVRASTSLHDPCRAYIRAVIARVRAMHLGGTPLEHALANERWKDTPEVIEFLKAPVAAATTTDATWAGPLVQYQNLPSAFVEFLQPLTIIGRIPGLTRVPFKVRIPRQTTSASVNWVGEGKPKPLSALAFDTITLDFHKLAGIVPITEECVRFSSPAIEALVRDDLANAITKMIDRDFIDPAKVEVPNVSPASITNGAPSIPASGTTAAALRTDVRALMALFLSNNNQPGGGVWIMTQQQALAINMMVTTLNAPEFPGITMNGGTFFGFPVVASENLPAVGGSPSQGYPLIFVRAPDILLADDGSVTIDASREASLQMESAPDSPPTASTVLVSLWQSNMVAVRAERMITWKPRRTGAVAYISGAKYAE